MTTTEARLLYCPVPSREEGLRLARLLVEAELVACANLLPGVTSVYRWEGRTVEDGECLLLAKTTAACEADAIRCLHEAHSYSQPVVLCLAVNAQSEGVLTWLEGATRRAR